MPNKLEHVFQECVGLVREGTSIAVCLKRYPNHAIELQPMLEATFATGDQLGASMPAMSRSHIRSSILDAWDKQHAPRRWPWQMAMHLPRLAVASAMVLVIVALSGTGVVMAAQDATPGTALYPVRILYEDSRLRLSFSEEETIKLYTASIKKSASDLSNANAVGQAHIIVERIENLIRDLNAVSQKVSVDQPSINSEINESVLNILEPVGPTIRTTIESAPKNAYPYLERDLELIRLYSEQANANADAMRSLLSDGSTSP